MPVVKGPLFSLGASGTIAHSLTYSKRRAATTARKTPDPGLVDSPAQVLSQGILSYLNAFWREVNDAQHLSWNDVAAATGASGYNRFLSANLTPLSNQTDLTNFVAASPASQGIPTDLAVMFRFTGFLFIDNLPFPTPPGWVFIQRLAIATMDLNPQVTPPGEIAIAQSFLETGPFVIPLTDNTPQLMGSLWNHWVKPDGKIVYSPSNTSILAPL